MNILIAKTILQSWINENDIALFYDDAEGNYYELRDIAEDDNNEEILMCLEFIANTKMIHILANKGK